MFTEKPSFHREPTDGAGDWEAPLWFFLGWIFFIHLFASPYIPPKSSDSGKFFFLFFLPFKFFVWVHPPPHPCSPCLPPVSLFLWASLCVLQHQHLFICSYDSIQTRENDNPEILPCFTERTLHYVCFLHLDFDFLI